MFKIKFPNNELMEAFIKAYDLLYYTPCRSTSTIKLSIANYNKDRKVYEAQEFQGEEII